MGVANYARARIVDSLLGNSSIGTFASGLLVFGALHTADPGQTCTASPVASCPRVAVVFNAAASATAVNATTVDWLPESSGTVTHISLWDGSATATANALAFGALATSKAFSSGDTIRAASGAITFTITTAS